MFVAERLNLTRSFSRLSIIKIYSKGENHMLARNFFLPSDTAHSLLELLERHILLFVLLFSSSQDFKIPSPKTPFSVQARIKKTTKLNHQEKECILDGANHGSAIGPNYDVNMEILAAVALDCVEEDKDVRPTMKQVVEMLQSHESDRQ
ncbi:hypothetical protein CR513_17557, partial [Mucuna pruriens]